MAARTRIAVLLVSASTSLALTISTSPPANDRLLRAARGESVDRTPVWLFRQAGRHMEEYREYKKTTGKHFLQLLEDPHDVAEVTMQPLRRYDVDAAILFSDILVVPQALGVKVDMPGGVGIVVPEPVTTGEEARAIAAKALADPAGVVRRELKHVTDAVTEIRKKQLAEKRDCALLGFSAAPWTLFYYTVGANSRDSTPASTFAAAYPAETAELLDAFEVLVAEYCAAQLRAGAHAIQIFEAMGASLDADAFDELALPRLQRLGERLQGLGAADESSSSEQKPPLLAFARGVAAPERINAALSKTSGGPYDVITLDTDADRARYREACFDGACLQGNLDPRLLVDDCDASSDRLDAAIDAMLGDFGSCQRLIANLGEGLSGKESQALVAYYVDAVHAKSAKRIAEETSEALL